MKNRTNPMSLSLPLSLAIDRPHNPFVAAARFRQAGSHRAGVSALRRRDARSLKREIDDLHPPHR